LPNLAIGQKLETIVESVATGEVVAWFPAGLERIATHPSGQAWAGTAGSHLHLFTLEGGD